MTKHANNLTTAVQLLGLLAWVFTTLGQAVHAAPRAIISHTQDETLIPLAVLNASPMPLDLRGLAPRAGLSIPVPARMKIESSELELYYTNSIALQARSLLAISLNERILAQLPLKAAQPNNAARISLPLQNQPAGYHSLSLSAAQHYADMCEDGSAAELFTQIDMQQSTLRLRATREPIPTSLAHLDELFDKRLWLNQFPLSIVSAEPALLEASTLAAQGVALRLDFIPVNISYQTVAPDSNADAIQDESYFPGLAAHADTQGDIVLIGSRQSLAAIVSPKLLEQIKGAYLGLFPLDADPTRGVLLISGLDAQQVTEAARVFALHKLALPDRQDIHIKNLDMPQDFSRLQGNPNQSNPPDENGWVSFSRLDFATTTLHGMYPKPAELNFWAFAEMFDPQQRNLTAELSFAYGAGFDQKSALNIFLNGKFIQALHLDNPHGEQLWRTRITIPVAQLKAGQNTLSFAPSLIGKDVGGECRPIFTENLYVSIADDSRIALPPSNGFMRLPDLSLLARTGLPYTQPYDGGGSALVVLDDDADTHSAALTLIGKLAQINKAALTGLVTTRDLARLKGDHNLLLVGKSTNLPDNLKNEIAAFIPGLRWQNLVVGVQESQIQASLQSWLDNPMQSPVGMKKSTPASAALSLERGLGQSNAAVQFQSSFSGGTVTLFSANDPKRLRNGINQLVSFDTWGALNGNGMLWSISGEALGFSFPVSHSFVGDIPTTTWLTLTLGDRPWLLLVLALSIILATSLLTWFMLRRRARRFKPGV